MTKSNDDRARSDRAREDGRRAQDELDAVLAALSHPMRRQILLNLKIRGESMSSGEIASRYACSWPTVSRHLSVLRSAGLVTLSRDGKSVRYHLDVGALERVWKNWFSYFDVAPEQPAPGRGKRKGRAGPGT